MGKKKKLFPFRFRWFSAPSAPQIRPITPPKDESKSQEQVGTTILIHGSPERTPARDPTIDIPIADPQQDTPSHPLQPEKPFSVANGSSGSSQSKSESLGFTSSFATSKPHPPAQEEKEKVAVTQQEQKPVMSPIETIPKSQEPTQPKIPLHGSEPIPNVKESPLRTTSKSQDQTQPETSSHVSDKSVSQPKTESHVFESMTQSKELPPKTIPKSQEPTQLEISPHVSEPIPHVKESPFRTISKSQDQTQPEASSHVSDKSASQPKTEAHVVESMPQSKESPYKTIPQSQEIARSETSPHVSDSLPHIKESPFRSTPKPQDLTQQEASSHVSESVSQPKTESHVFESKPQSKQSPSKTLPKSQEITQAETSSHVSEPLPQLKESPFRTILESQNLTQPETSSHLSEPIPHSKTSVFQSIPQSKGSPSKAIPNSQEITESETPSQLHESGPQLKESPSETSPKSKKESRLQISSHESAQKTQVKEPPSKTSPRVSKPIQPKSMSSEKHKAPTSRTQTIDQSSMVIREKRKRQDTQESIESKVMFASNSTGKDTKVVSSVYPVTKNVSSPSHQEDISPIEEKTPLKEGIKEDISKFVQKLAMGQPGDDMEDRSIRAIILAGENRGAKMHMGSESTKKEGSVHRHEDCRTDSHESPEVTTEPDREEGSSNNSVEPEVGNAYVNSNILSINNSLMYQGSVTEKDPGVQLILPPRPAKSMKSDDEDSK